MLQILVEEVNERKLGRITEEVGVINLVLNP